jgi:CRISPR-associated protein Cst1
MAHTITLEISDWMYNAGLVGIYNILEYHQKPVKISGQSLTFDLDDLEHYSDLYMAYMYDRYKDTTVLSLIYERMDRATREAESANVNLKKLNEDLSYIKQKLGNSAYKVIIDKEMLSALKVKTEAECATVVTNIHAIRTQLQAVAVDIVSKEIIGYYDQKAKSSSSPFAIVDKYINTGLFRLDNDYKEALASQDEDKSKFVFNCFQCDAPINKIDKGLNFLNNLYFDTNRKTSHVWNFKSDIEPCPVCKLVYMSLPAGMPTIHGRGLFVNANTSFEALKKVNNSIYHQVKENYDNRTKLSYSHLIKTYMKTMMAQKTLSLNDVQVIDMREGQYHFVMLGQQVMTKVYHSKQNLEKLSHKYYIENDQYMSVYDATIELLLENTTLFRLIDKLLYLKNTKADSARFGLSDMITLIKIENTKGVNKMAHVNYKQIDSIVGEGQKLKAAYYAKSSEHKITSIAYKLQGALRASNSTRFMDTILSCYSYVNKPIPHLLIDCLKDEQQFRTLGYAFTASLVGSVQTLEEEKRDEA